MSSTILSDLISTSQVGELLDDDFDSEQDIIPRLRLVVNRFAKIPEVKREKVTKKRETYMKIIFNHL